MHHIDFLPLIISYILLFSIFCLTYAFSDCKILKSGFIGYYRNKIWIIIINVINVCIYIYIYIYIYTFNNKIYDENFKYDF